MSTTSRWRSAERETASPSRRRARRGVTIVEILISLLMLTLGVGGALGSAGVVAKQMGGGQRQTLAASLAQTRLDSLTSLACAQLAGGLSGTTTTNGIVEAWTVVDGRNTKTLNITYTIPRRVQTLRYSTVIPCRD